MSMRPHVRRDILIGTALLLLLILYLHLQDLDVYTAKLYIRANARGIAFLWVNSGWEGHSNVFTHPDHYGYTSRPHFENRGLAPPVPCLWLPWWSLLLLWFAIAFTLWHFAHPQKPSRAFPIT